MRDYSKYPKTICVDFDGVITQYEHWQGRGIFDLIMPGAAECLRELRTQGWRIIIYTCRPEIWQVRDYLNANGIPFDYINFNPDNVAQDLSPCKLVADIYLDDRALNFQGKWSPFLLAEIVNFKRWGGKIGDK